MTPPVEVRHLRKVFGDKVAVADLSLTVERGEVFGFLGPNGAGKTTSVKMLLALIGPTSGEARILGLPPGDPRARRKVGFLPEHFRFHDWLKASEFLQLHADLYHMPRDLSRKRIHELLTLVGLQDHAGKKLHTYSSDKPCLPRCSSASGWPRPCSMTRSWSFSTNPLPASTRWAAG